MPDPTAIRAAATARQAEMEGVLAQLVGIDSPSGNKRGVDEAGRWMAARLGALGFDVRTVAADPHGDHLIADRPGHGTRRLMLLGHVDTVLGVDGGQNGFRVEGDRAFGAGVADMKGGLVVGLTALQLLRDADFEPYGSVRVVIAGDEEVGSPTSRALIESACREHDAVLVLEAARPTGAVVGERKGIAQLDLEVRGVAAHAGADPERGTSAVTVLARIVLALSGMTNSDDGVVVTVGRVDGGEARNTVPARARAQIDVRFPTAATGESVLTRMAAVAQAEQRPSVDVRLTGGINRPPMTPTPAARALAALAQTSARELGFAVDVVATGGGSDGNFTAALGVPTLDGLGAVGGHLCTPGEYIERRSLAERAALLALLCAKVCGDARPVY